MYIDYICNEIIYVAVYRPFYDTEDQIFVFCLRCCIDIYHAKGSRKVKERGNNFWKSR